MTSNFIHPCWGKYDHYYNFGLIIAIHRGPERFSDYFNITELVSNQAQIQTQD